MSAIILALLLFMAIGALAIVQRDCADKGKFRTRIADTFVLERE